MSRPHNYTEKVWAEISCPDTICNRLRGQYNTSINDGAGPLNGSMTFSRSFDVPPIQIAAAERIEQLQDENEKLKETIVRIQRSVKVVDEARAKVYQQYADNSKINAEAVETLASEREANAILTEENECLRNENVDLRVKLYYNKA